VCVGLRDRHLERLRCCELHSMHGGSVQCSVDVSVLGLVSAGARVINPCNTVQSDARRGAENSENTLAQSGSTVCSASLHRSGPAKRSVASNSPTDSGDGDGKRNDHIYGKMVDATLMKQGQRYLAFAPGTDRTTARGG
jgi:hypothetical protein